MEYIINSEIYSTDFVVLPWEMIQMEENLNEILSPLSQVEALAQQRLITRKFKYLLLLSREIGFPAFTAYSTICGKDIAGYTPPGNMFDPIILDGTILYLSRFYLETMQMRQAELGDEYPELASDLFIGRTEANSREEFQLKTYKPTQIEVCEARIRDFQSLYPNFKLDQTLETFLKSYKALIQSLTHET